VHRHGDRDRAARILGEFAQSCGTLGSAFYAGLLTRAAQDELAGGPVADVLAGTEGASSGAAYPLRLLAGVHALVLSGRAPALAAFYPSVGGSGDVDEAWPLFLAVITEEREEIRGWLAQPPQTNEVGRAAGLLGGLHVLAAHGLAIRLFEIGASAGLNLRADRFRVQLDSGQWLGPSDSPVVLAPGWTGRLPPLSPAPEVVERRGCDIDPIDPTTPEGRVRLQAYVWPDQTARLARLRGALDVAAAVPAPVVGLGAADFVDALTLVEGTTTVVWHSVMWQYLEAAEKERVLHRLELLGAGASDRARLARLRLEPVRNPNDDLEFRVVLQEWPGGGEERVIGVAPPHGLPVTWL
jgi:hypothetical protein